MPAHAAQIETDTFSDEKVACHFSQFCACGLELADSCVVVTR